MEKSLVLIKPDGVYRGLIGEIISRFERKGLKLVAARFLHVPLELAEEHYKAHKGKDFYPRLIKVITSGPVMAMVWSGPQCIQQIRNLVGSTDPAKALPGSIRGDFAVDISNNVVHASDSPETAEIEIPLWFPDKTMLTDYQRIDQNWLVRGLME